jgi:RNA recognition motif-containing protein
MPMFKIFVGNLDTRVTIEQVREIFAPFVTIEDAVLVADPKTGKAKGFAIIMVRDADLGRTAVKATQGKRLLGKTLVINEVMKKGKAAAKAAKEVRQGPFGPHFNRQGGGGSRGGGGMSSRGGSPRRGLNRGPRTSFGAPPSGPGPSGPGGFRSPPSTGGGRFGPPSSGGSFPASPRPFSPRPPSQEPDRRDDDRDGPDAGRA